MTWDITGKTVLITGATNGIGREAAVILARQGARMTIVGRDWARTQATLANVITRSGSKDVSCLLCDLSSQASVRRLAAEFRAVHDRLDVLINNAGCMNATRLVTEDGVELTFAVNHLAPFLLTNLLLDLLVSSAPARVVSASSIAHRYGKINFEDLGLEQNYKLGRAYTQSKLASMLFSSELARRLSGTGVTANTMHPGLVATNIWESQLPFAKKYIFPLVKPFLISAEKGGQRLANLAADPALEEITGKYYSTGREKEPAPLAKDVELAGRLWDVSAEMAGLPVSDCQPDHEAAMSRLTTNGTRRQAIRIAAPHDAHGSRP